MSPSPELPGRGATPPPLHAACVPVLLRYLSGLDRIVAAVGRLGPARAPQVLDARLAPDMLPFAQQVETTAHFASRTAFPLAGRPVPPFAPCEASVTALQQRIADTGTALQQLPVEAFSEAESRLVAEQAGRAAVVLPAARFLHEFALPNFLFHLNMAYAIARLHGCRLGKADYDGFHDYPPDT